MNKIDIKVKYLLGLVTNHIDANDFLYDLYNIYERRDKVGEFLKIEQIMRDLPAHYNEKLDDLINLCIEKNYIIEMKDNNKRKFKLNVTI